MHLLEIVCITLCESRERRKRALALTSFLPRHVHESPTSAETERQSASSGPKKKKAGLSGKLKSAVNKALDVAADKAADGDEEGENGESNTLLLKRKIKGLQVTVATLTAEKDKLTKDLAERTKSLNHYKGKKDAAAGGAKAEVDKIKTEFENYKRKSEDQLSKNKSYLGTLKKSLQDAEANLDKLQRERAAVIAANRDAHATAEEAQARQEAIDAMSNDAAAAEPLRKFAKEVCNALGMRYVEPRTAGQADNTAPDSGFLPSIGSAQRSPNPFKKATVEATDVFAAALAKLQSAVNRAGVGVERNAPSARMRNVANRLRAAASGAENGDEGEQHKSVEALEAELTDMRRRVEMAEKETKAAFDRARKAEAAAKGGGARVASARVSGTKKQSNDEESSGTPLWVAGSEVVTDPKKIKGAWDAAKRIHEFLSQLPDGPNIPEQPIASAARFNINLVINGVVGSSFEIEAGDKGIFTAAMHYFALDRRPAAAVDFTRSPPPGSVSSSLVCELVMRVPVGGEPYIASGQDMLGISITLEEPGTGEERELVFAPQVIQMDEVMLAARQSAEHNMKNFSIWPDLTSCWRWQDNEEGGWELTRLRWRFLLKKVFPEIDAPLQLVCL